MTAATIFREFNHLAIASNLSGRQMQLWLKLYEFLNSYRRQDVQLYTPMLLDTLQISISQFRRARQGLIDAGFLSIRQDSQQHTSYTLLLNGEAVRMTGGEAKNNPENRGTAPALSCNSVTSSAPLPAVNRSVKPALLPDAGMPEMPSPAAAAAPECAVKNPVSNLPYPSGDIMLNGGYQADLQAFFRQHPDSALSGWLQQWADMRRKICAFHSGTLRHSLSGRHHCDTAL